jgi:hypothetical protein
MDKWVDLDYRDFGMRDANYAAAHLYDSLLNKYYKKLLAMLKADDKKILIQARRTSNLTKQQTIVIRSTSKVLTANNSCKLNSNYRL